MKLYIPSLFSLIIACTISCSHKPSSYLQIEYKGINSIDINTFAFESQFVNSFPSVSFALFTDTTNNTNNKLILSFECLSIDQATLNGHPFNIFSSKIKGKLSLLSPNGSLLYSNDIELIKGQGATSLLSEIDALTKFKRNIKDIIEKDKEKLLILIK